MRWSFAPDGKILYVALANRDSVAAVDTGALIVRGYFDTRLPHQTYFGAEPVALALNAAGSRLYVANAAGDSVAVFDTAKLRTGGGPNSKFLALAIAPIGFVPTEWLPFSLATTGGKLYIATRQGPRHGAEQYAAADSSGHGWQAEAGQDDLYRHAALWLAGRGGRGGD